jgi:paraquat-inducible protein B
MGKRANPAIIGGFVVGAVVLTVVAVAAFGSGRLFRKTYPYVIYFTGDVNGLNVGGPVKFKGVPVGSVKDIMFNVGGEMSRVVSERELFRIPVVIELDEESVGRRGARNRPDPAMIKQLIVLGLRAQLAMESIVTGLLYVKLDMHPETPAVFVADPSVKYVEIPAIPTPLEQAQMKAAELLAKLEKVEIGPLISSLNEAVAGANNLLNSPNLKRAVDALPGGVEKLSTAADSLDETLVSVRKLSEGMRARVGPLGASLQQTSTEAGVALRAAAETLEGVQGLLAPESPLAYQLAQTLADFAAAAQAVRRFAEELERSPTILVRGKAASRDK